MDQFKKTRNKTIADFAAHAAALFAADPRRRSAMLAVSQYWNDSANDEVHGHVIVSTRETPVWPHECEWDNDTSTTTARLEGEQCWDCGGGSIDMSFYGGYGDSMVAAFESFCRESAHQGMEPAEAYIPFAIARRGRDVELVGHLLREPTHMIDSAQPALPWPDDRARMLFDLICQNPDDDTPRWVLSDHLLERNDPRGEAIALALARELDDESRARRDRLFVEHGDRWLFPLGDVIPAGCAHYERGFLARVDVHANASDRARVIDAPVWGTVHTLRFAPESVDILSQRMTSLRDVGPFRGDGLVTLARSKTPWSIETLRISYGAEHEPLVRATNLPKLRVLEISEAFFDELHRFSWLHQLERLVIVGNEVGSLSDWRALRATLGVRELGIAIAPYWSNVAAGWEIGFRADDSVAVRSAGFHESGTMMRLAEILDELPETTRITLVSTPAREMTEADATWLRDYAGRDVSV